MKQYLDLCQRIINKGEWLENKRTGTRCKTVINANFSYDLGDDKLPMITTRKTSWRIAIAELLGYIRGETDAQRFKDLGTPTWFANANDNQAWLNNPHRKGDNDMGFVYGAVGRNYGGHHLAEKGIDQLKNVLDDLSKGNDSRGEIITFWDPSSFEYACLRPCMHTHQFSLLGDKLYLNSYQRSADLPLGVAGANQVQVATFARLIAQIISHSLGRKITATTGFHSMVNCHIYENQLALMKEQIKRVPYPSPTLTINPDIKTLQDLETWVSLDDFKVTGYQCHEAINYPFSV